MSLYNGQIIKLKSILHLKALFIGFIMIFNLGVTAAHAQSYQTHWFSEEKAESGENEAQCNGGISAIECDGGNCDNMRLTCKGQSLIFNDVTDHSLVTISEERPNNSYTCPQGQLIRKISCDGGNCDNVGLQCAPVNADYKVQGCAWSGKTFSEEDGRQGGNLNGKLLAGLECSGNYCDNKKAYACDIVEAPEPEITATPTWTVGNGLFGCCEMHDRDSAITIIRYSLVTRVVKGRTKEL